MEKIGNWANLNASAPRLLSLNTNGIYSRLHSKESTYVLSSFIQPMHEGLMEEFNGFFAEPRGVQVNIHLFHGLLWSRPSFERPCGSPVSPRIIEGLAFFVQGTPAPEWSGFWDRGTKQHRPA